MRFNGLAVSFATALLCCASAFAAEPTDSKAKPPTEAGAAQSATHLVQQLMKPQSSITRGRVTVNGKAIDYQAEAGTLVLDGTGVNESVPEVAIGYVAYSRQGAVAATRPISAMSPILLSTTVDPAPPPCGCTWGRGVRSA